MARMGRRTSAHGQKSDNPTHEYKSFVFQLEDANEESGEFSGYAAVFGNVDSGRDVIERGAFSKTIREDFDRIKILSQHNDCDLPIGKPLELREDEKGLYIRGKISDTQRGRDIKTLLKDGVLNELSIGYDAITADYDEENGIRHLKEIKLWEVSIVTWAMNDQAKIDEVKSLAEELRIEAKAGKITRSRLNALKPFIAVVRELVDILGPLLEPAAHLDNEGDGGDPQPQKKPQLPKKPKQASKKAKPSDIIFEIVP